MWTSVKAVQHGLLRATAELTAGPRVPVALAAVQSAIHIQSSQMVKMALCLYRHAFHV